MAIAGIRRKEPLDDKLPVENATLMKRIYEFLDDKNVLSMSELFWRIKMPSCAIEWATNITKENLDPAQTNNVIELRQKA